MSKKETTKFIVQLIASHSVPRPVWDIRQVIPDRLIGDYLLPYLVHPLIGMLFFI